MYIANLIIQLGFWITWLLIPIIYELIPAIIGFFSLQVAKQHFKKLKPISRYPYITLIIPVYNSEDSLYSCIESIQDSSYPNERIKVLIADNQSKDKSFEVYMKARDNFPELNMQWLSTDQGKAKALNASIYNSIGKYVIHVDSDGVLQKDALLNIVTDFENDSSIDALTGTILTRIELIKKTKSKFLKFVRENEYLEYCQSFLAGRAVESQGNRLFTMSGAFSAFRRDKLLETNLYNIETIGEDIDMTFQIRYQLHGRALLCPLAIFYVSPLDNMNKLYTQRQRWLRGELETLHLFFKDRSINISTFFHNFVVRRLVMDHTILLLRVIWTFAFLLLIVLGYSTKVVMLSFVILYFLYLFILLLNFLSIQSFLKKFPSDRKYYLSKFYILFSLPIYYFICSFIQVIGIINAMTTPAKWTTKNLTQELLDFKKVIKRDWTVGRYGKRKK
ncbi:TIGR03111 family XrtG-associated glycosyltransferase [Lactobacillus kalixensis]|uniref:Glycosyltransferase n=1 Tax=Lactobacillus kalixensis DSM 16043 TaxID=1423763 RepID=A0A0R1U831_9LACO|nr:TIGR03111 family XrtG-associated glycosyltransferase [Lactobacillus kalixensis]KRL87578.1 glycosyltransferase [Lactobacillus kalixensis DSM 16043]